MIFDIPKTKNDTQLLRMIDQGMSSLSTPKSRRGDIGSAWCEPGATTLYFTRVSYKMIVDIPKTKNDTQLLRMIDQGMSFSSTPKSRRDDIMVAPGVSPVPQNVPVYPRVVHMIVS